MPDLYCKYIRNYETIGIKLHIKKKLERGQLIR